MDWDDVQIIYLRTKVTPCRLRGPRKRKVRQPSTPQLRKRWEAQRLVPISREGYMRLTNLPLAWMLGRRVFWKEESNLVAIGALSPKGMLQNGRYYSSRLRKRGIYTCSY